MLPPWARPRPAGAPALFLVETVETDASGIAASNDYGNTWTALGSLSR
jgi:hypothetical protein